MYVCMCTGVTSNQIEKLLEDGTVQTREDIQAHTGAGSGCGCCQDTVTQMVEEFKSQNENTTQNTSPNNITLENPSSSLAEPKAPKPSTHPIPLSVQVLRQNISVSTVPISKIPKP